jgi:urease accessory protein
MASAQNSRKYKRRSNPKAAPMATAIAIITAMATVIIIMIERHCFSPLAFVRLQTWLSPAFPTGAYSYSHGLEWAVEAAYIKDRESLVDWLEADLRYGSGRNEAIFFSEAWHCTTQGDRARLVGIAELAAAFRGTSEFALESSQ